MRSPIVYCDPLKNPLTVSLKALGNLVICHILKVVPDHCIISNDQHHVLHILAQPNEIDCEFYVMLTIRMMVEEFIQGYKSTYFEVWPKHWRMAFVFVRAVVNVCLSIG